MNYDFITEQSELIDFCNAIADSPRIAFDTEFVSEDSYRPILCLVQIAAGDRLAAIDSLAVEDLTPLWNLLTSPTTETIVHAAREEVLFCVRAIGKRPARLIDTQVAAGFVGLEYPAAYSTLVSRLLDVRLGKGETRTNWQRRPLSRIQLDYAVRDVIHLEPLADLLHQRLSELGRESWLVSEMDARLDDVEASEVRERWAQLPRTSGMSPRTMAVARELWRWREQEAKSLNRPARRVLRDDLLAELARRQSADLKQIKAVRGMEWSRMRKYLPFLSECVERGLSLPEADLPRLERRAARPQRNLLTQFLCTALGSVCRSADIAPGLVGTSDDVRDLIAYHLGLGHDEDSSRPELAKGWRAEIVGNALKDLLHGSRSLRVTDPLSDQPLGFEPPLEGEQPTQKAAAKAKRKPRPKKSEKG